jgi:tRNA-Thr(GGU) m(6)t(6)A37 methyltransferase TsaA
MTDTITLQPIGVVRSTRTTPDDDQWDRIPTSIVLDVTRFTADALAGLNGFSHIEVTYHFHMAPAANVVTAARHPRGRTDWPKVGIFAQRAKDRPNRIGTTICKLVSIDGLTLHVVGLDAIDGTPVLDIKPCMRGFLPRGTVTEPAWATELMDGYWD